MDIELLYSCAGKNVKAIGNKAYSLKKLHQAGFTIPNGIVITVDVMKEFLYSIYDKTFDEKIIEIKKNPISARKELSCIRDKIKQSRLDKTLLNKLCKTLRENHIVLSEKVSVRSSSVNEDNGNKAFAGVYQSYINIDNETDLENAILGVWASAFSEVAFLYGSDGIDMAVIIQQMVICDCYGVVFSKAPSDNSKICIEISSDVTGIVDGTNLKDSFYVDRNSLYNETLDLSDNYKLVLKNLFLVEKTQNMYCDIEFAIKDNMFVLLQCRPITTNYKVINDFALFSQDDEISCNSYYLGDLIYFYSRYLGKQYYLRKKIIESGFHVYKQYYLICKKNTPIDLIINKVNIIFVDTELFILELPKTKSKTKICRRDQILETLSHFIEECKGELFYCRIGEIIQAEKSGYACLSKDNRILIEYIDGRIQSIQEGKSPSTQISIDKGKIEYITNPVVPEIEVIDEESGKKKRIIYNKTASPMTNKEIQSLEEFTKALSSSFPFASFEWYIYKDKLYGKDISVETNKISVNSLHKNIVSRGQADGYIYLIDDLFFLEEISEKYDISLYAHSKDQEDMNSSVEIKQFKEKIQKFGKPIIFLKRPTVGILAFVNDIAGVVFEQGAVLSHVGISLRENKIPAVIDKNMYQKIKKTYKNSDFGKIKAFIKEDGTLEINDA